MHGGSSLLMALCIHILLLYKVVNQNIAAEKYFVHVLHITVAGYGN